MRFNIDCLYYIGEKPCRYNRLCEGCGFYKKSGFKILVIKLGAMGDVVRTTPLIETISKKYPDYHLTWLVDEKSSVFLSGNPFVHRVLPYGHESSLRLMVEEFDVLYCLDKEIRAVSIASLVKAENKFGFGFHPVGNIYPFNALAEYSLALGMSDEFKFIKNEKTYQRDMLDTLGFENESYGRYILPLDKFNLNFGYEKLTSLNVPRCSKVVGLNTGAGDVFATKRYPEDYTVELIRELYRSTGFYILLLGGPGEFERNKRIIDQCEGIDRLFDMGCSNTIGEFTGILNACDVVVSTDTLALHLSLGLGKRIVALFGSTCAQEIDMYGLGEKIVSSPSCAPCYKKECPFDGENHMLCMRLIPPQQVLGAVNSQMSTLKLC